MKKVVELDYVIEAHNSLVHDKRCLGGIKDKNLLISAVNGQYWYEYGVEQIIHVAYSICANHVFFDGNKRTAFLTLKLLEIKLGYVCDWNNIAHTVLELATNGLEKEKFSSYIKEAILLP